MISLIDLSLPIPEVLTRDGQAWAGSLTGNYGLGGRYRMGTVTTIDTPPDYDTDFVTGISDDGEVVTGGMPYLGTYSAFRWEAGVMQPLLDPGDDWSAPGTGNSVSADGSVVVGAVFSGGSKLPVVWQGGVRTFLPLPVGATSGDAESISADGRTIVGSSSGPDGNHAVMWHDGVVSILPDLPGQVGWPGAFAVSDDGTTIVGAVDSASSYYFARWVNGNLKLLWNAPYGFATDLFDVSADGSLAIFYDGRSLIWRDGLGTKTFEDYVERHYGLSVDAIVPNHIEFVATNVSADGRYFTAWIADQNYNYRDVLVYLDPADFVIPEPSTLSLAGLAAVGLVLSRLRSRNGTPV
jgi:hypothetical protein